MLKNHHRSTILMAAIGAALSAGGSIAAPAYPDDGRIRLVHATTEQLCEFDTEDQARNFHDALPEAERSSWRPVGDPDVPHKVIQVDLDELRASLAADAAKENAHVAEQLAAEAAAPVATPIATETPAASPATGETPAAGE